MRATRVLGWVLLAAAAGSAGADERPQAARTADAVAAALPPALVRRIQASPDSFRERTGEMIAGYGGAAGLDAAAIDRFIAVTRAEARAYRIADLMAADLDDDGSVTAAEVAELAPLLAARARGRLIRGFAQGDADRDGVLAAQEMQAAARKAGLRRMSEAAASALRAVMAFDLDRDGRVTAEETAEVVKAASRTAPNPPTAARGA